LCLPSIRLSYFNGPLKVYGGDEAVPNTNADSDSYSDSSDEEDVKAEQARFQEVLQGVKIAFRKTAASVPQPHGQLETLDFEGPVEMEMEEEGGIKEAAKGDLGEQSVEVEKLCNNIAEELDLGEQDVEVEELCNIIAEQLELSSLNESEYFF
jgi:hypothetical protein